MAETKRDSNQKRKVLTGLVVSNKMQKTAVVRVDNLVKHRFYKKYVVRTKRFKAHDEENQTNVGDLVSIVSSKPISKHKRWVITKVIRPRAQAGVVNIKE